MVASIVFTSRLPYKDYNTRHHISKHNRICWDIFIYFIPCLSLTASSYIFTVIHMSVMTSFRDYSERLYGDYIEIIVLPGKCHTIYHGT